MPSIEVCVCPEQRETFTESLMIETTVKATVVAHTHNLSLLGVEAGELQVQGQPGRVGEILS